MPRPAVAGTAAGPLTLDTGFRGYYSSGVSPANIYYKEFAIVGMQFLSATLSPEIALYQQYQITDGNGDIIPSIIPSRKPRRVSI